MIGGGKAAGKEACQRLRTFDQRVYSLAPVRGLRIGGKVGEMIFGLRVDLFTCLLKQRLLEAAIAELAGEVADRWEEPAGDGNDPVK